MQIGNQRTREDYFNYRSKKALNFGKVPGGRAKFFGKFPVGKEGGAIFSFKERTTDGEKLISKFLGMGKITTILVKCFLKVRQVGYVFGKLLGRNKNLSQGSLKCAYIFCYYFSEERFKAKHSNVYVYFLIFRDKISALS